LQIELGVEEGELTLGDELFEISGSGDGKEKVAHTTPEEDHDPLSERKQKNCSHHSSWLRWVGTSGYCAQRSAKAFISCVKL
jgi:hypothetical protein